MERRLYCIELNAGVEAFIQSAIFQPLDKLMEGLARSPRECVAEFLAVPRLREVERQLMDFLRDDVPSNFAALGPGFAELQQRRDELLVTNNTGDADEDDSGTVRALAFKSAVAIAGETLEDRLQFRANMRCRYANYFVFNEVEFEREPEMGKGGSQEPISAGASPEGRA